MVRDNRRTCNVRERTVRKYIECNVASDFIGGLKRKWWTSSVASKEKLLENVIMIFKKIIRESSGSHFCYYLRFCKIPLIPLRRFFWDSHSAGNWVNDDRLEILKRQIIITLIIPSILLDVKMLYFTEKKSRRKILGSGDSLESSCKK